MSKDITAAIDLSLVVKCAWHALDDDDRGLLELKANGEDCSGIAQRYNVSEEAIKKRLQRARRRFSSELSSAGLDLSR